MWESVEWVHGFLQKPMGEKIHQGTCLVFLWHIVANKTNLTLIPLSYVVYMETKLTVQWTVIYSVYPCMHAKHSTFKECIWSEPLPSVSRVDDLASRTHHTEWAHVLESQSHLEILRRHFRKVEALVAQYCESVDSFIIRRQNHTRFGGANPLVVFLGQSPSEKRV